MRIKKYLFILLFLFNILIFADGSPRNLEEGYMLVEVKKKLEDPFFGIFLNYETEKVYIGLRRFLDLIELPGIEIDREKKVVSGTIKKEFFRSKREKTIYWEFDSERSFIKNDELYIEAGSLPEIIPITNVKWDLDEYKLTVYPNFYLNVELREKAEKRRNKIEKKKKEKEKKKEIEKKFISLGMAKLKYSADDILKWFDEEKEEHKEDYGKLDVDYRTPLLYGDFATSFKAYPEYELNYWRMNYPDIFEGKTVEVGDTYLQGNNLFDASSQISGIVIKDSKYKSYYDRGKNNISGFVPNGITIELYQNKILVDYQDAENNSYEFENIELISYSDTFILKFYDQRGLLVEEREIKILSGKEFLNEGSYDYNLYLGETKQSEKHLALDISYGILDNLSYKLGGWSLNHESEKKDEYNVLENNFYWRTQSIKYPLKMKFQWDYDLDSDKRQDTYLGDLILKLGSLDLDLRFEHYSKRFSEEKKLDKRYEANLRGRYKKLNYTVGMDVEEYTENKTEYKVDLSYRATKTLRFSIKNKYEEDDLRYGMDLSVNYSGSKTLNFILGTSHDWKKGKVIDESYELKVNKRRIRGEKLSYGAGIDYNPKTEEIRYSIDFTYYFTDNVNTLFNYESSRESIKMNFYGEKVVNLQKPFAKTKTGNPETSWIEGLVFLDSNGNGKKDGDEESFENVEIFVGNRSKGLTGNKGEFYIDGIQPYKTQQLDISYENLDPMLAIAKGSSEFIVLPASGKKISIPLIPISTIAGNIFVESDKFSDTERENIFKEIEVQLIYKGQILKKLKSEMDGFFMFEDVQPGEYTLKIEYKGEKVIKFKDEKLPVNVKSGEYGDFYDGFVFEIESLPKISFIDQDNGWKI